MVLALFFKLTHARQNMDGKKKVLGFYGVIEFGDYLHGLSLAEHTFQMEDARGQLIDCAREEVLLRFQNFCAGDGELFRVRITQTDPRTATKRHFDKILRRSKPPASLLARLSSAIWGRKQAHDPWDAPGRPPGV